MLGQHAIADDLLFVVQVVDQHVQRGDPLPQPALKDLPVVAGNNSRDDVERNDPLQAVTIAVDIERNAELLHRPIGRPLPAGQII